MIRILLHERGAAELPFPARSRRPWQSDPPALRGSGIHPSIFGQVISKYTREQAITGGELADIYGGRISFPLRSYLCYTIERIPKAHLLAGLAGAFVGRAEHGIRHSRAGVSRVAFQVTTEHETVSLMMGKVVR